MAQAQTLLPNLISNEESISPLMAQYRSVKARHQDSLVFFRLGDFYELFFEDAVQASKALDITLTRRGQHQGQDIPMCGVPAHAYEAYLAKLIRQGFRVALCEQMEDPTEAKKRGAKAIVTREVVRVVTPGTLTEDQLLDHKICNYICCLTMVAQDLAVAWLDLVAGVPYVEKTKMSELGALLARLDPVEILLSERLAEAPLYKALLQPWRSQLLTQPNSRFDCDNAKTRLLAQYKVISLDAFGDFSTAESTALGVLIDYVGQTQNSNLIHLDRPQKHAVSSVMAIDPATRRNLELTRTLSGERGGSFLASIDRTQTGAGARLLNSWLSAPLINLDYILERQRAVAFMVREQSLRGKLIGILKQTPDLERPLARLSLGRGGPRDLEAVRGALYGANKIYHDVFLSGVPSPNSLLSFQGDLVRQDDLILCLEQALADELPMLARDGNFIARGYSEDLDKLIELRDNSRRLVANLQQKYMQISGVSNLKIRHNQVLGYYIEVTPVQSDKLLAQNEIFIHRQSLTTACRFSTVELSDLDQKIAEAAESALTLELVLFDSLVKRVVDQLPSLRGTAEALANMDVYSALASLAVEQNYSCPLLDNSMRLNIEKGRHPVVEQALRNASSSVPFIANNCSLGQQQRLWLLTGPNMAGKSTFLRQNALIVILAQIGSFVPAEAAQIGLVDRLFSRVGAADDLARGRSTFMVEMVETAGILNQASERALVILDEIGRGTATFDGLSIAWATLEHLHDINRCRGLFATHYHELTLLAQKLSALACYTMSVKEWNDEIIFLHEVREGVADRSYGIHVAQMAGLPTAVILRAEEVMGELETKSRLEGQVGFEGRLKPFSAVSHRENKDSIFRGVEEFIQILDPDKMTPREALEALYKLKQFFAPNGT